MSGEENARVFCENVGFYEQNNIVNFTTLFFSGLAGFDVVNQITQRGGTLKL